MADWTVKRLAARIEEAAVTAHRLPPVRVQGYVNCWPIIARQPWETYASEPVIRRYPPNAAEVDRMLEVMQWIAALDEDLRHLLWMRARYCPWKVVCTRLGCDRTTAWRRWRHTLLLLAVRLNAAALASAQRGAA